MAFKDITKVLYDKSIQIEYKDKTHRYYVREFDQETGKFGKSRSTRGVTTIMDNVLEKKGLMTWPMGMALKELFGFYDFTNEKGQKLTGFSSGQGTLWNHQEMLEGMAGFTPGGEGIPQKLTPHTLESALPLVQSAAKAWQRRQKKGADIGSLVHDAIEHYIKGEPFEVSVAQYKLGQEFATKEEEYEWLKQAEADVECANLALGKFIEWWDLKKPIFLGAEDLVYSREYDYCGTFDALIELDGKRILCDWKTSNASASAGAPDGVYYSYFIQSAAYARAWLEMHRQENGPQIIRGGGKAQRYSYNTPPIDDLMIVSCRKDGGFATIKASDVDLSVEEAIAWWEAVMTCYRLMSRVKANLAKGI